MILVDAIYINKGGGKILLDLIINKFSEVEWPVLFLLDKRVEGQYDNYSINAKYIVPSLFRRHQFYSSNKNLFSVVFTFGNIPPTIKLKCDVYTYFHNALFLVNRNIFNLIKFKIIKYFSKNTNIWFVQSVNIKLLLQKKLEIHDDNIMIMPVFQDYVQEVKYKFSNTTDNNIKFLYVSTGEPHKNHLNLLYAFKKYNLHYPDSSLTLTIGKEYKKLYKIICDLQNDGININNLGFISRERLLKEYENTDIFIFPSLTESFGLGLVEAAQHHLPIITSNLDYVYQLIEPTAVFNPYDLNDIYNTFLKSNIYLNKNSKLIVKNKIENIYNMIYSSSQNYMSKKSNLNLYKNV